MRVVLTGWRTITTGRGKLVNGHYVRGGAIAEVNWTNHTYVRDANIRVSSSRLIPGKSQ